MGEKNSGQQGIVTYRGPLKGSSRAQNDTKKAKTRNIFLFPALRYSCVTLTHKLLPVFVEEEVRLNNGSLGP